MSETRRQRGAAGINNWLGPGVLINARTVVTYNVRVSIGISWRPSVPLTLTLNETFHNLNRPGLPGGAFRSARKAEIGLGADMRRSSGSNSRQASADVAPGPFVCAGCCSQLRNRRVFGNRSYVSGLFVGSRAVASMGLRTHLGLISGKVDNDLKGRQTLGA